MLQLVEVLRRYSRRGDLRKMSQKAYLVLTRRVARTEPIVSNGEQRVHRVDLRLSTDQVQALVRDYGAGTETAELQRRYGLSRGSVRKLLTDARMAPHRRLVPDDVAARCVELYGTDMTLREVGREMDLPKSTVRGVLLRAGVIMRQAHRRPRV